MLTFQFTVQLLLTFAATIAGGALLFMSIKATPTSHELRRTFLFAGIALLLSGWAAICFAADINRALACRMLRERNAPVPALRLTHRPISISIEDPQTIKTLKLVTDDIGILYCDAASRLFVIEGVFFRYVVRAGDVLQCYIHLQGKIRYVILTYRVAGSNLPLSITLSRVTAGGEFLRKFSADSSRPPLADVLERTLGITISHNPQGFPVLPLPLPDPAAPDAKP
jgi:hypothetical protein